MRRETHRIVAGGALLAALLAYASGCVGIIGDGSSDGAEGAGGAAGDEAIVTPQDPLAVAAAAHARRLTVAELRNSMRDVFALDDSTFPSSFPLETSAGNLSLDNQFVSLTVTPTFAGALQDAAEWAGRAAVAKLATLLPCAAQGEGDAACAAQFVDTYGRRAYRRPLAPPERAALLDLFATTRMADDFPTSIATVIEAMLQSPNFLYRTELGSAQGKAVPLAPYEIASALSYFFWQSTPDPALLDGAASGHLATQSGLREAAQRMLGDPRAAKAARSMFIDWLGMTGTLAVTKSVPDFNPTVSASMLAEVSTFLDTTVWGGAHGFRDLFTSTSSFVDANLASIYGVPSSGSGLVPTPLDPSRSAGFLTMPGFVAMHTPGESRGPIQLGHFVRSSLFCQPMPPPPPGIPPAPIDPNLDEKARYYQHDHDATCQACHGLMDPLGFAWSQFDAIGRFAPMDQGVLEDGRGHVSSTDVDGDFAGPVQLGTKLLASKQVQSCFVSTVLGWALGRKTLNAPRSADAQAIGSGGGSGFVDGDLKALFASIATSDAFLFRDTTAVPQGGKGP